MNIQDYIDKDNLVSFQETGSHYICNPPVLGTDIDYIMLVNDLGVAHISLTASIWEYTSLEYEEMSGDNFKCYRSGIYNLIVTQDVQWYVRFCAATEYCKTKNVLKKEDRIMYFELILNNKKEATFSTAKPAVFTFYDPAVLSVPITGLPKVRYS